MSKKPRVKVPQVEMPGPKRDVTAMTEQERYELIAIAAYYLSEQRGFEPGHELEDWIRAEAQLEALIAAA